MKKSERERVVNNVAYELSASGYQIRKPNDLFFVAIDPKSSQETVVMVHTGHDTLPKVNELEKQIRQVGKLQAHVFYKADDKYLLRIAGREALRANKSFKRHVEDLNDIVHLRGLEKHALENSSNVLAYYQPKTERLPQGVRLYQMNPVILDYSHLPEDHISQIAHGSHSIDYKIAKEIAKPEGAQLILNPRRLHSSFGFQIPQK